MQTRLFIYYRRGAQDHVGYIVARDIERAKEICPFPDTLIQIEEKVIDMSYEHTVELL